MNNYFKERNKQLLDYYNKVKFAFSPEIEYNDDLTKEQITEIFGYRNMEYNHLSIYERELFEKIFLAHFLEELEKVGIIKILK